MIFRNVVYSDLIGFHFGKMDPYQAAWELYDRLKDVQQKLHNSTDKYLVTIALDGENCWECFHKDGIPFLTNLYRLLSEDNSLNITTVSDYLEKNPPVKSLSYLHSGSWISRDFHIWIGDPAKNLGWNFLEKSREDLLKLIETKTYNEKTIQMAWEELYIAEGSDWFWWYGDPNVSAQDDLFDEQFRLHLQNIYRVLGEPIPEYLFVPVEVYLHRSSRYPSASIGPTTDSELEECRQTGFIDLSSGSMYQSDKILRRIWFGTNRNNLNIKLDTIQNIYKNKIELYIYAYNPWRNRVNNHIRLRAPRVNIPATMRYRFGYEVCLTPSSDHIIATFSEAIRDGLWELKPSTETKVSVSSIMEISIPFRELQVPPGEEIHFVIVAAKDQVLSEIAPESHIISVKR
jgi:alpha-amylase/alpha-mannosidase (GH57 family)